MYDGTHPRFVDAHAEGVGTNDNSYPIFQPIVLPLFSFLLRKSCMVGRRRDTLAGKPFADLAGCATGFTIDDAAAGYLFQDLGDLADLIFFGKEAVGKIGAGKGLTEKARALSFPAELMSSSTGAVAEAVRARRGTPGKAVRRAAMRR